MITEKGIKSLLRDSSSIDRETTLNTFKRSENEDVRRICKEGLDALDVEREQSIQDERELREQYYTAMYNKSIKS